MSTVVQYIKDIARCIMNDLTVFCHSTVHTRAHFMDIDVSVY